MRKHGLAPSYDGVPSEALRAKAERGTMIHKEIEQYIKCGELGFTTELYRFIDHININNIKPIASEEMVYNDVVAGTIDLVFYDGTIADIKTTASLHKEAVSWQLSIYSYLYASMHGSSPEKGEAYHFNADGELKVVDIPLKPVAEVESLIKQIEEQKKAAEAQATELREALMAAMEANGVTSFENERIKLTYVAPTTRTAIDSARLKKELPDVAKAYTKTSNVKASLRITLKEG